jgi:hypothetical protein
MNRAAARLIARASVFACLLAVGGCKGCPESSAPVVDAAAVAPPVASSLALGPKLTLPLSRPFSAALGPGGDVYVAGLVAARGVIGVARMTAAGDIVWVRDAIARVSWSLDATVHVLASARGLAVSWRGAQGRDTVQLVAMFDKDGAAVGAPARVGSGACATEDGVVSTLEGDGGVAPVVRRAFVDAAEVALGAATHDLSPMLACGDRRVYLLEEGDQDVGLSVLGADAGRGSAPLFVPGSGEDEEREHGAFTHGDGLGFVRVTARGSVRVRDALPGLTPWRRADLPPLPEGDDWLAVDGDASFAYVVVSRDAAERCDAGVGSSDIRVVRVRRSSAPKGATDSDELAGALPCGVDLGSVFTGSIGKGFVVAWTELGSREGAAPPIASLAYRQMGAAETGRIEQAADAVSLAGCDANRCYAVALVRTEADAMAPGAAKIIAFP